MTFDLKYVQREENLMLESMNIGFQSSSAEKKKTSPLTKCGRTEYCPI